MSKTPFKRNEGLLQNLSESYLTRLQIPYLHLTTFFKGKRIPGMTYWPDLLIFMPKGRPLLVELKSEKGEPSDGQIAKFADLEASGYPVQIVRDFEEFENLILSKLGR